LECSAGIRTRLFRPPYGILRIPLLLYCMKNRIALVMWSLDCGDSFGDISTTLSNRLEYAKKNDIVLMHDDSKHAIDIVSNEIPHLIERGFSFATVSSMLGPQRKAMGNTRK
jgi:peptidoglycan-N-acetylglucosamine deacetylase